jgi:hypothetical protein
MRGGSSDIRRAALRENLKNKLGISPKSESQRDRPTVTTVVTWGKMVLCMYSGFG